MQHSAAEVSHVTPPPTPKVVPDNELAPFDARHAQCFHALTSGARCLGALARQPEMQPSWGPPLPVFPRPVALSARSRACRRRATQP